MSPHVGIVCKPCYCSWATSEVERSFKKTWGLTSIHRIGVFCIFRFQSISVGISGDNPSFRILNGTTWIWKNMHPDIHEPVRNFENQVVHFMTVCTRNYFNAYKIKQGRIFGGLWHPGCCWLIVAFITWNSNLVPLLEGLRSSNPCRFDFLVFGVFARIEPTTRDLMIDNPALWPTELVLHRLA